MEIFFLHLYSDILNLYGESANLKILKKHIEDQGFVVIVEERTIGDSIEFDKYDFIYIGCGSEESSKKIIKDLIRYKTSIKRIIDNGKTFLATGNSVDMFGKAFDKQEGMNIFDFETVRLDKRIASDVVYRMNDLDEKIIGCISKMTETYHNFQPLFKVIEGVGENRRNDFEGVRYNNFYGTHVLGPLFAKNPALLKYIVQGICTQKNPDFLYKEVEYLYENKSHNNNVS